MQPFPFIWAWDPGVTRTQTINPGFQRQLEIANYINSCTAAPGHQDSPV